MPKISYSKQEQSVVTSNIKILPQHKRRINSNEGNSYQQHKCRRHPSSLKQSIGAASEVIPKSPTMHSAFSPAQRFFNSEACHESLDWTNTTSATSFSENDEFENHQLSRDCKEISLSESPSQKQGCVTTSSEAGCDSESSSSYTRDSSECAVRLFLPRERAGEDVSDDDQSWSEVPLEITFISDIYCDINGNDTSENGINSSEIAAAGMSAQSSLYNERSDKEAVFRLERVEAMLESYRNALKSNEHLIESLEQTLLEARETAQDSWAERNRLEQELEDILDEQDAMWLSEKNCLIRRLHTTVLALSILCVLSGGSDYVLIFASTVYLLEDLLNMYL